MAGVEYLTGADREYIERALDKYTAFSDIKTALAHVDGTYLDGLEDMLLFESGKRLASSDDSGTAGSDRGWAEAYWNVLTPAPTAALPATFDTAGGEECVIYGSLFCPGCTVTVGGEPAEVLMSTPGHILIKMPALAAAADNDIVVTNERNDKAGTLTPGPATAKKTPVFTAISPNTGPIAGGIEAVITGSEFTPGMVVTIGGHACTVLSQTSTTIRIMVPAHAAGALDVVITAVNTDADTETGGFTYV